MRFKAAGADLEAAVTGKGPALLFLHAFPLDGAMWASTALAFERTHLCVRFDARGFGRSPRADGLLTMERLADDAVALLDHLGLARAVVCGCSMGGYAAFALARRHPARLRGLVLVDTRAIPDAPEGRRTRALQAERIVREGAAAAVELYLPKLLGATTHAQRPEVVAYVRDTVLATSPRAMADALAGLAARADSRPTLREIEVPTLVVAGEEDAIVPRAETEALAAGIRGGTLDWMPAAGHLPSLENPAAFEAALARFLDGLGSQHS